MRNKRNINKDTAFCENHEEERNNSDLHYKLEESNERLQEIDSTLELYSFYFLEYWILREKYITVPMDS